MVGRTLLFASSAMALARPGQILLSAVASYLGAGAHLITAQILDAAGKVIGGAKDAPAKKPDAQS